MFHWDLPQPLQDLGGWTNPVLANYFEDYARVLYTNFGDRVNFVVIWGLWHAPWCKLSLRSCCILRWVDLQLPKIWDGLWFPSWHLLVGQLSCVSTLVANYQWQLRNMLNGTKVCPETSVSNTNKTLRKIPESPRRNFKNYLLLSLVQIYRFGRKFNNHFSLNIISIVVFATEQVMHCARYRILPT